MQLTNIARDVVEDSKNNRFYITEDTNINMETIGNLSRENEIKIRNTVFVFRWLTHIILAL